MPPFSRTICPCPRDVDFCIAYPGHLVPGDLVAIAKTLMGQGRIEEPAQVLSLLRASKGAVVGDSRTGRLSRVGTITPKVKAGRCIFLDEQNLCTIHAVAPFGCAYFDAHMPTDEADRRSLWGLWQIQATPGYEMLRQLLMEKGEVDPVPDIVALNTSG